MKEIQSRPSYSARLIYSPTAFQSSTARQNRFRQLLTLSAFSVVFTSAGFLLATAPAIASIVALMSPPSDAATLRAFKAPDEFCLAVESYIENHPLARKLRADPAFHESKPHMRLPPAQRKHNLTSGTLLGPGKVPVPPLAFTKEGEEVVVLLYLGTDLCGHVGMVHGGMLGTLIDEGLAAACFAALPNKTGVTANLNINYRNPTKAGSYIVLKAKTQKVEGRKAWVEGRIETLGEDEEPGTVLVEATALYIEPKYASVSLSKKNREINLSSQALTNIQIMKTVVG